MFEIPEVGGSEWRKPDPCGNALIKKSQTLMLGIWIYNNLVSINEIPTFVGMTKLINTCNVLAYKAHQQLHLYNLLGLREAL